MLGVENWMTRANAAVDTAIRNEQIARESAERTAKIVKTALDATRRAQAQTPGGGGTWVDNAGDVIIPASAMPQPTFWQKYKWWIIGGGVAAAGGGAYFLWRK